MKIGMSQLIRQTAASRTGLRAVCQRNTTQVLRSYQAKKKHMNVLKLTAVNFALQAFTKGKSNNEVKYWGILIESQ